MQLSVLIRNLNEAQSLKQTLCSLKRQQANFAYEVVVIDNESDDDSVSVAEEMGCKVFTLQREAFTFGHALNYGIEKCEGEIILILSAHVVLLNEFFLEKIPEYFNDPKVAALRFVNAASAEQVKYSLQNGPTSISFSSEESFANDHWQNFIVNHCAAIRRSCWKELSFDEQIFASEDKLWSIEILKKGYSILYNVPGFYLYAKPFNRSTKIKREVIEESAKELITGKTHHLYTASYPRSFFAKLVTAFKRLSSDLRNHADVYNGIKKYRRDHKRAAH